MAARGFVCVCVHGAVLCREEDPVRADHGGAAKGSCRCAGLGARCVRAVWVACAWCCAEKKKTTEYEEMMELQRVAKEAALATVQGACGRGFLLTDPCVTVHNENLAKLASKKSQKKAERKEEEMDEGWFCLLAMSTRAWVIYCACAGEDHAPKKKSASKKSQKKTAEQKEEGLFV